ncbi:MAG: hypothetical protein HC914_13420 [Chloroflexaceae bacterium]|nr:hypothetical protein [Chloroflexaceae bacterium]
MITAMLDLFIRHAHYLTYGLLLWLSVAHFVAAFQTSRADTARRSARFTVSLDRLLLVISALLPTLFSIHMQRYLDFWHVVTRQAAASPPRTPKQPW